MFFVKEIMPDCETTTNHMTERYDLLADLIY